MKIDDLLTELIKLKNKGVKEVTIDPKPSIVYDAYGYINLFDNNEKLIRKIRIIVVLLTLQRIIPLSIIISQIQIP